MSKNLTDGNVVETLAKEFEGLLVEQDAGLAHRFANAQLQRAERLGVDRARMVDVLGADNPRVVALDAKIVRLQTLGDELAAAAEDRSCVTRLEEREWAVFGRIMDSDGNPLAGMQVRLVTPDGSLHKVLKPVKTNARGGFRVVYHGADLGKDKERRFSVLVQDENDKTVFRSSESIEPLEGSFTSLNIALSQDALEHGAPNPRCEATTTKGTQCRNTALTGSTFCGAHSSESAG